MLTDTHKTRSEDSYLFQDIAPLFERLGYPRIGDKENIKVKGDIKIRMGSTLREPDLVYYTNGDPILLIEAKKPGGDDPFKQAFSYIRLFPSDQYSASKIRPKYFACTEGSRVTKFCKYMPTLDDRGEIVDDVETLPAVLTYQQLLEELGMANVKTPLTGKRFQQDVFYTIVRSFIKADQSTSTEADKVTKTYILKTTQLIYQFLRFRSSYTSHQPYTDLDGHPDLQQEIRRALDSFDWVNCDHVEIAQEFRLDIHRAFQKGELNQYITPSEVVKFMTSIVNPNANDSVLDFECGSGGFIFAALQKGVSPSNICGIDLDELPYFSAKVLVALYLGAFGEMVETEVKIEQRNGLLQFDRQFDIVMSNPSGSSKYPEKINHDLQAVLNCLESDLDSNGRSDSTLPSEYYLSIQRAVISCKVGGKIALVLPEGFFSNSSDTNLRGYVAKYCHISAIISLPRGIFYKGNDTSTIPTGKQQSNQKMSILFAQKTTEVDPGSGLNLDACSLNYKVLLGSIATKDNLGNKLKLILEEQKFWEVNGFLDGDKSVEAQPALMQASRPIQEKLFEEPLPLFEEVSSPLPTIVARVSKSLQGLFGK